MNMGFFYFSKINSKLCVQGAYKYYRKYLSLIEFDNRFVTKYFERIDLRRKNKGLMNLLPLKSVNVTVWVHSVKLGFLLGLQIFF